MKPRHTHGSTFSQRSLARALARDARRYSKWPGSARFRLAAVPAGVLLKRAPGGGWQFVFLAAEEIECLAFSLAGES